MKIWEVELRLCSDFHTAGEIRGAVIHILKNKSGMPYIPSSHIKGVVRTEAERIWFGVHGGERKCYVTGAPGGTEENPAGIERCKEEWGCPICGMFGVPEQEHKGYKEAKVKFTDFLLSGENKESERAHVRIKREIGAKEPRALFTERTIEKGCVFKGFILMRDMEEEAENLLRGALHSASDYGFGGGRTRGLGWVEIKIGEGKLEDMKDFLRLGVG
jgi:CRISPR/Cas system CSM-associated protein Csm3 (group 7 of RAMP superfamily)